MVAFEIHVELAWYIWNRYSNARGDGFNLTSIFRASSLAIKNNDRPLRELATTPFQTIDQVDSEISKHWRFPHAKRTGEGRKLAFTQEALNYFGTIVSVPIEKVGGKTTTRNCGHLAPANRRSTSSG